MITPTWVATRTQPIAVDDVVRYLVGVLALPETAGRVFEVGGPEVLQTPPCCAASPPSRAGHCRSCRCRCSGPRLSSLWLTLVTDVRHRHQPGTR